MLIDIPDDQALHAGVLAAWDRPGPGGDLDGEEADRRALALVASVRSEKPVQSPRFGVPDDAVPPRHRLGDTKP